MICNERKLNIILYGSYLNLDLVIGVYSLVFRVGFSIYRMSGCGWGSINGIYNSLNHAQFAVVEYYTLYIKM